MDEYVRILKAAAEGTLPKQVDESSTLSVDVIRELVDAGLLKAIDASTLSGTAFLEPKITFAGREYLRARDAEGEASPEGATVKRRGIALDGESLREIRRRHAFTQTQLAERADLSMLTVSKAERGALVDASTLSKLAAALGVPVEDLHSRQVDEDIPYQSVFISYGGPDQAFAELLYDRLAGDGLSVFFFPKSAVPGEKLHRTMAEGVRQYDRVLLICSEASLLRPGVLNELEQVLMREAEEGGSDIVVPITIDNFIFSAWNPEKPDVATQLRARVILSFEGATAPGGEFDARYQRLLAAFET